MGYVEQPSKQVKEYYKLFDIKVPSEVDVSIFKLIIFALDKKCSATLLLILG